MKKRLLQIVMHNYFTYILFGVVICLPITTYIIILVVLKVLKEVYQESSLAPDSFKLVKQNMIEQGVI